MHLTWAKCVAVDPDGRYARGARETVDCNGTPARPRLAESEVIGLDRFYTYRLRDQEEVAAARVFMQQLSHGADEQERMVTGPGQIPDIGDHIALMAMHVTTKEMDAWTFQTFWWSPTPDASLHAAGRPSEIRGVWANYLMCTAYSMATPRTPSGGPHVCFNPYLEVGSRADDTIHGRHPAVPGRSHGGHAIELHAVPWPRGVARARTRQPQLGEPRADRQRGVHGAERSVLRQDHEDRLSLVARLPQPAADAQAVTDGAGERGLDVP